MSCLLLRSVRGQRSGEENLFGGDVGLNRCNPDSAHSQDDASNWGLAREQSGATKLLTIILSCQEAGAPTGGRRPRRRPAPPQEAEIMTARIQSTLERIQLSP